MQFYILNTDPTKNAILLPTSMLRTNVREGWQILSDIGHIHGLYWNNQNKLYSQSHAKTLSFCRSKEAFTYFYRHYYSCVLEFKIRNLKGPWVNYNTPLYDVFMIETVLANETPEKQTARISSPIKPTSSHPKSVSALKESCNEL